MKKVYSFFILVFLIVFLFCTAASCSGCRDESGSATGTTGDSTIESSQQADQNGSETVISTKNEAATDKDDTGTGSETTSAETKEQTEDESTATTQATAETPTIKLEIAEGPTYSSADDVCYYRIKAIVTGSPDPTITFSKDDSMGAWGKSIVQVNIHGGETYTLTATAENSAGSASDSMDLEWGCSQSSTTQDTTQDGTDDLFDVDLITIETKPGTEFIINAKPVLTQSILDPSDHLKVGQIFYVRCQGYDLDGDDIIALIAYSSSNFQFLEKVTPMAYKLKALKAGTSTIDTDLRDEHNAYSNHILLTIVVEN